MNLVTGDRYTVTITHLLVSHQVRVFDELFDGSIQVQILELIVLLAIVYQRHIVNLHNVCE